MIACVHTHTHTHTHTRKGCTGDLVVVSVKGRNSSSSFFKFYFWMLPVQVFLYIVCSGSWLATKKSQRSLHHLAPTFQSCFVLRCSMKQIKVSYLLIKESLASKFCSSEPFIKHVLYLSLFLQRAAQAQPSSRGPLCARPSVTETSCKPLLCVKRCVHSCSTAHLLRNVT